jgi:hypothetical protein
MLCRAIEPAIDFANAGAAKASHKGSLTQEAGVHPTTGDLRTPPRENSSMIELRRVTKTCAGRKALAPEDAVEQLAERRAVLPNGDRRRAARARSEWRFANVDDVARRCRSRAGR